MKLGKARDEPAQAVRNHPRLPRAPVSLGDTALGGSVRLMKEEASQGR